MKSLLGAAAAMHVLLLSSRALAYRPFDGTDADVADLGTIELEVGPVAYLHTGSGSQLVVPAFIFNYGFWEHYEFVAETKVEHRLYAASEPRTHWVDSALSIKQVLRAGVLQAQPGLSIANEWSLLLPDAPQGARAGAELTTIFSQRTASVTLHLNIINEFSLTKHYVLWFDPILEGPYHWRVRPVTELMVSREFGAQRLTQGISESVLVGAIGRLSEAIAIDGAVRLANTLGTREQQLRLGFTVTLE